MMSPFHTRGPALPKSQATLGLSDYRLGSQHWKLDLDSDWGAEEMFLCFWFFVLFCSGLGCTAWLVDIPRPGTEPGPCQ